MKYYCTYNDKYKRLTFFNDDGDNDGNGLVLDGGNNDGEDDAATCEGKVCCEGEADDDGDDDSDNGGVNYHIGVDINDSNDANGVDDMCEIGCDDDADGGDGNSNDYGSVDGNGIFKKWCIDGKCDDMTDDGDDQTESLAGDIVECKGSSKMEMRMDVMQIDILMET